MCIALRLHLLNSQEFVEDFQGPYGHLIPQILLLRFLFSQLFALVVIDKLKHLKAKQLPVNIVNVIMEKDFYSWLALSHVKYRQSFKLYLPRNRQAGYIILFP